MSAVMPFAVGIGLGVISLFLMRLVGIADRVGPYVVATVAIASFYVVFAIETGGPLMIAAQIAIALGFTALAAFSALFSPWWIVGALALHAAFDVGSAQITDNPAPEWWAAFCLAIDTVLAIGLGVWISRGRIVGC